MTAAARKGRSAKAPGVVFCACAGALLILVATALSPAQPPPPPTAAYAPEAVKTIKLAPPSQTSRQAHQGSHKAGAKGQSTGHTSAAGHGGGSGGNGAGPGATTTTTTTTTTLLPTSTTLPGGPEGPLQNGPPTAFDCVDGRQIPDPESPPCVTTIVKDNGGATSRGVTGNLINIAMPSGSPDEKALINFFNQRFDFYGRKLNLVSSGCFGTSTPSKLTSAADNIAQKGVFADLGWCDDLGTEYPFYDELAKDGVVSVANRPSWETEQHMAQYDPYEWTFWPTFDQGQTGVGDLACSLVGQKAQYGGPAVAGAQRKFAIFYDHYTDAPDPDISALISTLNACGASYVQPFGIYTDRNNGTDGQGYDQQSIQEVQTDLAQASLDHVTTLIDLVHPNIIKQIAQEASAQGYEPEHIVSSYLYNADTDTIDELFPPDQQGHIIGVTTWNKEVHPQDMPWYYAVQQGDPTFQYTYGADSYYGVWYDYYPLLVLAAGIQMAGPDLTPETFAKGLQQTTYPNPVTSLHEGIVSIHPGQHSYISDQSIVWYSPNTPNPDYQTAGSYCFFEDGTRIDNGDFPQNPQLQTLSCPRYN